MRKQTILTITAFIIFNFIGFAQEDIEKWYTEEIQGSITEIDSENRELTVTGQEGNIVTIIAGDEVERFNELVIGDIIKFDYWTYIKAEFRKPTKEELEDPLLVIAEAGKADLDTPPGATVGALINAIVTVEVINRPYMNVVVKGPEGEFVTIPVENTSVIEKLNVGQVIIITYAEAMAIYIEKIPVK